LPDLSRDRPRGPGRGASWRPCRRRSPATCGCQVLLDLSDPLRGGRANVALLAARTGIDPKKLSPHLGKLKDLGLIFSQREGKEIWYEAADARVRYERRADGHFSLTVTGRGSGVAVTAEVGSLK
jgi:DNA-binding transcriptional ArsR family regulator